MFLSLSVSIHMWLCICIIQYCDTKILSWFHAVWGFGKLVFLKYSYSVWMMYMQCKCHVMVHVKTSVCVTCQIKETVPDFHRVIPYTCCTLPHVLYLQWCRWCLLVNWFTESNLLGQTIESAGVRNQLLIIEGWCIRILLTLWLSVVHFVEVLPAGVTLTTAL